MNTEKSTNRVIIGMNLARIKTDFENFLTKLYIIGNTRFYLSVEEDKIFFWFLK